MSVVFEYVALQYSIIVNSDDSTPMYNCLGQAAIQNKCCRRDTSIAWKCQHT